MSHLFKIKQQIMKSDRYFLIMLESGEGMIYFQRAKMQPAVRAFYKKSKESSWKKTHNIDKIAIDELVDMWKDSTVIQEFREMDSKQLGEYMNAHFDEFM